MRAIEQRRRSCCPANTDGHRLIPSSADGQSRCRIASEFWPPTTMISYRWPTGGSWSRRHYRFSFLVSAGGTLKSGRKCSTTSCH
jgi:hypothetical protein